MTTTSRAMIGALVSLWLTQACGGNEAEKPECGAGGNACSPASTPAMTVATPDGDDSAAAGGGPGASAATKPVDRQVAPGSSQTVEDAQPPNPSSGPTAEDPAPVAAGDSAPTTGGDDDQNDAPTDPNVPTTATLFWLDIMSNRVIRSDERDFSDSEVLVRRTNTAPDGVAIDVDGGKIYWSNMGSLLGTGGGTLQRANLDGTDVETIVESGIARTPKQMQIDVVNGHAYWCDREGAKVWRAGLDGASPETLVSGHGLRELVGVALDVPGRTFYFSDRIGRKIMRASFDMPTGETADNRTDVEELFTFPSGTMPLDLDLDLEEQVIYWTDRNAGTVSRANMDLPAGETPGDRSDIETLVTGLRDTIGISLDLVNDKIYYTELGGGIHESALDGSGAHRIANSTSATGVAIAHLPE